MSNSFGVIGFFKTPTDVLHATEKVRDKGYKNFDSYSPYPIHGMDDALGVGRSFVPWITLIMGLCGLMFTLTLQVFSSSYDGGAWIFQGWPVIIGGKPMISLPAFIPVMSEGTVLFAGHCTVLGMLIINGLPNLKSPLLNPKYAARISNDEFAVFISSNDGLYNESEAQKFLQTLGANDVQVVSKDD